MKSKTNRRMHPSLFSFNYLHVKCIARSIKKNVRTLSSTGDLKILDVGAGSAPYYIFFDPYCKEYYCIDKVYETRKTVGKTTYVPGVVDALPFENDSFDYLISTQLLSSLLHPEKSVNEMYRILKPGGSILITDAFVWNNRGDTVLHRWAMPGARLLFAQFRNTTIEACDQSVGILFYITNVLVDYWHRKLRQNSIGRIISVPLYLFYACNNLLGSMIILCCQKSKNLKEFNQLFYSNFVLTASK